MEKNILIICCISLLLGNAGCQITGDESTDGALTGAGIGAIAGQLLGGDTKSTLIGTAIGAGGGYIFGQSAKNQKVTNTRLNQIQNQINTEVIMITNSNGSTSYVVLQKDGYGGYIGPRKEHYRTLPTEDQLKPVYGF